MNAPPPSLLREVTDKVTLRAATAYARLTMSTPIYRDSETQFEMTVTAVCDLGGGMRQITFTAPEFATFERCGADEYFGLVMPKPGEPLTMPPFTTAIRSAIAAMDEHERPDLRWYTIRAHRPEAHEIDVDIVTHGDSGPGSAWAVAAAPGQVVGFRTGGALFRGHECDGEMLLVADETAVPAVAAIFDAHPEVAERTTLHVEVADPATIAAYDFSAVRVQVHQRGTGEPGSAVLPALQASDTGALSGLDYAWLCGESALATSGRRFLVGEAGVSKKQVMFSGYWKLGQARG